MPHVETATAIEAQGKKCEDRVAVFSSEQRTVIVVADGAGGVGSGNVAAESVIREVKAGYPHIHSANQWTEFLHRVDHQVTEGEATAVIVDIRPYGIAGSSVGDSQAWIVNHDSIVDLTGSQRRKPLVGSGNASPVPFVASPLRGVMLIGTDGFFNYAKRDAIQKLVAQTEFYSVPAQCIELVRLPSGDLWDDIGIVAVKNIASHRTRQRYSI